MDLVNYSDVMKESVKVLEECFNKYNVEDVFLSFNGGKDCTVLLDLTLTFLKLKLCSAYDAKRLKVYYIRPENPFPELENFIFHCEELYKLQLIVVNGSIKDALDTILRRNSSLKACLMGSRSTDPHCEHLHFFETTDKSWPQIIRVSPLLSWSYHQIWSYLLDKKVPYCALYDSGYTSIGNTNNTIPNPSLKDTNNGHTTYKPAFLLEDGSLERNGRVKSFTNGKL